MATKNGNTKFVPMEKRSKKEQKEAAKAQRGSWLGVNPVTRSTPNSHELKRRAEDKDAYLQMKNYKEDM